MNNFIPGTVVSVMAGPIEHFGIVSDLEIGGMPCIISNSRRSGQVAEEPVNVFADGKTMKIHGYPSRRTPAAVIACARSQLGKAYNLVSWNCEHFIRWAHGLKVESPQLRIAVVTGLVIFALFYLSKKQ